MEPRPSDAPAPRAVLDDLHGIPGWLTEAQAGVLHHHASGAHLVVEVGSHQGRSTVALAHAVGPTGTVVAVDPFVPDWRYGADDTEARLRRHLAERGLTDRVDVRVTTSQEALAAWREPVDLVFVDGKHDHWSTLHDLGWSRWLRPGSVLLVHDAFSSLGVTTALVRALARPSRLRYVGREGSLAYLEVGETRLRWGWVRELPWWGRNTVVKVLLRLRLRAVARLLGHRGSADPF